MFLNGTQGFKCCLWWFLPSRRRECNVVEYIGIWYHVNDGWLIMSCGVVQKTIVLGMIKIHYGRYGNRWESPSDAGEFTTWIWSLSDYVSICLSNRGKRSQSRDFLPFVWECDYY